MKYHQSNNIDIDFSMKPTEMTLKRFYENNKNLNLTSPNYFEDIRDIFLSFEDNYFKNTFLYKSLIFDLDENTFFDDQMDVTIYQHLRYLPSHYHKHVFFEVVCVLKGSCINYICNNQLEMQSGHICIIPPNTQHAISVFDDDSIIFNILIRTSTFEETFLNSHKNTDMLTTFFTQTLYNRTQDSYLLIDTHNDKDIYNFIIYTYDEIRNNLRYKNRMVNSIMSAFFISLLRNHEKNFKVPNLNGDITNTDIIFILRYLQEHYNNISMNELSTFFNYSERQMQRILQTYTGSTFTQNVKKLKMSQADNLLKNTNLTIANISEQLGYCDNSNFRKDFKKYYNQSPSEYRKNNTIF